VAVCKQTRQWIDWRAHQIAVGDAGLEQAASAAPRGTVTRLRTRVREIAALRAHRARVRGMYVPSVREWLRLEFQRRWGRALATHCPVVLGLGVGNSVAMLAQDGHWGVSHRTSFGDRRGVARSYKYPVLDHNWFWAVPADGQVITVGGVATFIRRRDAGRTRAAAWVKKGRGYDLVMVRGWLVGNIHVVGASAEQAEKKARKLQRARVASEVRRRAGIERERIAATAPHRVWIDVAAVRRAGACGPGLDAGVRRVCDFLGGEVGAVRLDVLSAIDATCRNWAMRAVTFAHISAG
jgi:hypothetical protein